MGGPLQQGGLQRRRLADQGAIVALAEPAQGRVIDRLGRKGVVLARRQADEIPGEQEARDLTPTVGQQLVHPHRTRGDVEHVPGRIALADQPLPRFQRGAFGDGVQFRQVLVAQPAADGKGARAAAGAGGVGAMSLFGEDKEKKKDTPAEKPTTAAKKKYNVGVSKGGVPFKEAFKHHRGKGAKTFTWNGKKYTTELDTEKAKRTAAAKKPAAKKKVGGIRRALFGADGKMGGEKGLLDNKLTRAFTKRDELNELRAEEVAKKKPVKKMGGGMMKSKMASKGGARGGKRMPTGMKAGGSAGKKFPDLSGDGKVTQKDILMGKGIVKKQAGGMMKSKMASKGGAKGGRKPGGMQAGGMMKSKMSSKGGAKGGRMPGGMQAGGMAKKGPKGYAKGGAMTKKGMAKGGPVKKKAVSRKPRGVGAALRGYGKAMKK